MAGNKGSSVLFHVCQYTHAELKPFIKKVSECFASRTSLVKSDWTKVYNHATTRATLDSVCRIFNVTSMTVRDWGHKGLIRNDDKTYDLAEVYKFLERRWDYNDKGSGEDALKVRSAKLKIEKMEREARIEKIEAEATEGKYILKEKHESILVGRANTFRRLLDTTRFERSKYVLGIESTSEAQSRMEQIDTQLMEAFTGGVEPSELIGGTDEDSE